MRFRVSHRWYIFSAVPLELHQDSSLVFSIQHDFLASTNCHRYIIVFRYPCNRTAVRQLMRTFPYPDLFTIYPAKRVGVKHG